MAIYADADANYLTRANPWASAIGDLTFCFWVKFTTLPAYACPVGIDDGTNYMYFEYDPGNTINFFYKDTGVPGNFNVVVNPPSTGVWYFLCNVKQVGNRCTSYGGPASAAALVVDLFTDTSITTHATTTDITVGRNLAFTGENANGAVAHFKIWDAALTAAEVERERWSARPRRTADLKAWYPLMGSTVASSLADYSGNGFALTQVGTPTVQDGPPVGWGASPYLVGVGPTGPVGYSFPAIYM